MPSRRATLPCAVFPIGVALSVWIVACSDAGTRDANVHVDTVNGIEHTVAADVPERGDEGLERLWRAPDEAAVLDGTEWANPTWIAMNQDHIAVLDPQVSRVHLFTPAGERSGSFGQPGEGPGELARPMSVGLLGDSVLVTSMFSQPALQWFGSDGTYLGSARSPGSGASAGAYFLPGAGVIRQVVDLEGGASGGAWEHLDFAGERHSIELPGDHPMQPQVAEGGEGCWRRGSAGPYLVEVDCTFPLVRIVDPTGQVVREHRIDRAPRRTSDQRIEEAVALVESRMRASSEGVPLEAANQLIAQGVERIRAEYAWTPVMSRVSGSVSGHRIVLVEQLPEELDGGPGTLHILSADGRYLARHGFDLRIRSVAVSDTRLVVMLEDERTGLRHMEGYRLP